VLLFSFSFLLVRDLGSMGGRVGPPGTNLPKGPQLICDTTGRQLAASKASYDHKMCILYTAQFARDFLGEKRSQRVLMMCFRLI
jgi:hypothetical protein